MPGSSPPPGIRGTIATIAPSATGTTVRELVHAPSPAPLQRLVQSLPAYPAAWPALGWTLQEHGAGGRRRPLGLLDLHRAQSRPRRHGRGCGRLPVLLLRARAAERQAPLRRRPRGASDSLASRPAAENPGTDQPDSRSFAGHTSDKAAQPRHPIAPGLPAANRTTAPPLPLYLCPLYASELVSTAAGGGKESARRQARAVKKFHPRSAHSACASRAPPRRQPITLPWPTGLHLPEHTATIRAQQPCLPISERH